MQGVCASNENKLIKLRQFGRRILSTNRRSSLQYFPNQGKANSNSNSNYKILGLLAAGGAAYYLSHLERVPESGRVRFLSLSASVEQDMARATEKSLLAQYRGFILPSNHPSTIRIIEVARKLIQQVKGKRINWKIYVVQDKQLNAFVLPNGSIFVFTGILPVMQDNDGIATVLSHEISHVLCRHGAEKLSWMSVLTMLRIGLAFAGLDPGPFLSRLTLQYGILLPNSRACESEADKIGLNLMAKACFNPASAVSLWERMSTLEKGRERMEFASTHPSSQSRIKNIREWLPEAKINFNRMGCEESRFHLDRFFIPK